MKVLALRSFAYKRYFMKKNEERDILESHAKTLIDYNLVVPVQPEIKATISETIPETVEEQPESPVEVPEIVEEQPAAGEEKKTARKTRKK